MNTLILTGSDKSMSNLLDLTIPSKQKYASIHGYDFMALRTFSADTQYGFDSHHIGFLRASFAFKMLRYYDNVMWLDADALVTNFIYKINDFLSIDACFTASHDWMHYGSFSTGNFILSKNEKTTMLFNLFLTISRYNLNNILAEQATFNQIYNNPEHKHFFNVLPHKYLNSVPSFITETKTWKDDTSRPTIIQPWTSDSFLAHFTGASTSERINMIENNLLKI